MAVATLRHTSRNTSAAIFRPWATQRAGDSVPQRSLWSGRRGRRHLPLEKLEDRWLLALTPFNILSPTGILDDATPEITWEASGDARPIAGCFPHDPKEETCEAS